MVACWDGCINIIYMGQFKAAFVKETPCLRDLWSSSKEQVDKHVRKHDPVGSLQIPKGVL